MAQNDEAISEVAREIGDLPEHGVSITHLPIAQEESLWISASDVDRTGNSDETREQEARVKVSLDSKPDDLDSDLYYNQEEEDEEEIDNSSVSSVSGKEEAYKSLLSEFDDFVANEKNGAMVGTSRALRYGFEIGDMVWGKVKSHPWWPGRIFDEGFASSSVRRTRREGHVLVAFFGDSSYGWFDPAELIPFEDNFEEKAQQTNAKHFVKAVEEAVDEASRRSGLGVLCKCRSPLNFRDTGVDGYFAVDVPDFEPNGVYSEKQIVKYREEFQPAVMLDFVKRVAAVSREIDVSSMDFVKCKATAFAFRRAVFEEYDETYGQAFGVLSSSSSKIIAPHTSDQPIFAKAPLSGPLVIAETLSESKNSKKTMNFTDNFKLEKYVLVKRDDSGDENTVPRQNFSGAVPSMMACAEESSVADTEDYVIQKRVMEPGIHNTCDPIRPNSEFKYESYPEESISEQDFKCETMEEMKCSADTEKGFPEEVKPTVQMNPRFAVTNDLSSMGIFTPEVANSGAEERLKVSSTDKPIQQTAVSHVTKAGDVGLLKVNDGELTSHSFAYTKNLVEQMAHRLVEKDKILKRALADSGSDISTFPVKKKRKQLTAKMISGAKVQYGPGKDVIVAGKAFSVGLTSKEDASAIRRKKEAPLSSITSTGFGASYPLISMANVEFDIPNLLKELHHVALEPFSGLPRKISSVAMNVLLRFRSLYYQKSLAVASISDTERLDAVNTKSSVLITGPKKVVRLKVGDRSHPKPEKTLSKSDDPTISGRKRMPSDRQDAVAAKKPKKMEQLKSLAEQKKTLTKTVEIIRTDANETTDVVPSQRPAKQNAAKQVMAAPRSNEPTMLVMKFPPQTSLPSGAELKAKFARFGSIDASAIRVFWKSSTCRVVFRQKRDAEAAYKYAIANSSLFGNLDVRYSVREVGTPGLEVPDSGKGRDDAPSDKDPLAERSILGNGNQLPLQSGQLKSILKKPSGDEGGQLSGSGNGGRGTRVKFMLSGEESGTPVGNRTIANDGGVPTSVAPECNSKNLQKSLPPSQLPPLLPLPQYGKPLRPHTDLPPRSLNLTNIPPTPTPPLPDFSKQMLSLLTRCNDVVSTISGIYGYVPYRPL